MFELPSLDDATLSVVIATIDEGKIQQTVAFDTDAVREERANWAASAYEGSTVVALLFPMSLEMLQLSEGAVPVIQSGTQGPLGTRPLWHPEAQLVGDELARDSDVSLSPFDTVPPVVIDALDVAHLPPLDIERCAAVGGCLDLARAVCSIPCARSSVAAPEPPAPPVLEPCPVGWATSSANGVVWCEPFPGGVPECLDATEAHFVGEPDCAPVGGPCPSGTYAPGLPATAVYVSAQAAQGGDGSEARPFATISEALAVSPPDAILALGKGTFRENIVVERSVTIVGACARETTVVGTSTETATWELSSMPPRSTVELSGLTAVGGFAAFNQESSSRLVVRGVVVDASQYGFRTRLGSELALHDVVIGSSPSTPLFGIVTEHAAQLSLNRVVVRDPGSVGVQMINTSSATVRRTAVIAGPTAVGIGAGDTRLTASEVVVWSGAGVNGIELRAGSRANLRLLVVKTASTGVRIAEDAEATIAQAYFDEIEKRSISVEAGSTATIQDVVARNSEATDKGAYLIETSTEAASVHVGRIHATNQRVLLSAPGLIAEDLTVLQTTPVFARSTSGLADALVEVRQNGDRQGLRRIHVECIPVCDGSESDCIDDGCAGNGFEVGNKESRASDRLMASDLFVTGKDASISVEHGAQAYLARVAISGGRGSGLRLRDYSKVQVSDVTVTGVRPRVAFGCARPQCPGNGVYSELSDVQIMRFDVRDSPIGVQVLRDGSVTTKVSDGIIAACGAALVMPESVPLDWVVDLVRLEDNGAFLKAAAE